MSGGISTMEELGLHDNTVMVLLAAMTPYSQALKAYLEHEKQADLADKALTTQASISRYATGERFPSREIAELIDKATEGKVPLALWIGEATKRFGLAA